MIPITTSNALKSLPKREELLEIAKELAADIVSGAKALKDKGKGFTKAKAELLAVDPKVLEQIKEELKNPHAGDAFKTSLKRVDKELLKKLRDSNNI